MKLIVLNICIVLFFSNPLFAQRENAILAIRNEVQEINIAKNYLVKKIDNDYFVEVKGEVTDGGQNLVGYYKDNQLKKIIYKIGLSYGVKTSEFYFVENILIFVFVKQMTYEFMYNDFVENEINDYTKFRTNFEGRYYFKDNKIIKTLNKGNEMFSESTNKEKELLVRSKELINDLKIRN